MKKGLKSFSFNLATVKGLRNNGATRGAKKASAPFLASNLENVSKT